MKVRLAVLVIGLGMFSGWKVRSDVGKDFFLGLGGDSKFYFESAQELYRYGHFGGPDPAKADARVCRPPGYALFLDAIGKRVDHEPGVDREFTEPLKDRQYALDLATCVLVFLLGLALGGELAAVLAFLALLFHPVPLLFPIAILSETLATFVTTAAVILLLFASEGRRLQLCLAALAVGLAILVRTDGIFLVPALVLAGWRRGAPRFAAKSIALALAVALFLPALWTVRNWRAIGRPLFGTEMCDNNAHPIFRTHYMSWVRTWLTIETQYPGTLWLVQSPWRVPYVSQYPPEAFDSPEEKNEVQRLFLQNRNDYFGAAVDEGFARLALARQRRHPLRNFLELPGVRAWNLVTSPVAAFGVHLPGGLDEKKDKFAHYLVEARYFAFIGLLILGWHRPRAALVLGTVWLARVVGLAYGGFIEGRYLVELLPLELALAATALAAPFNWLMAPIRRRVFPTRPS